MRKLMKQTLVAAAVALCMSGVAVASELAEIMGVGRGGPCSLKTLDGLYVFSATGYNIVAGGAQPKAIIEFIRFNGDGTIAGFSVSTATRSVNGVIARSPPTPAGGGTYAVQGVPDDSACTGTLTFAGGPSFDLFTVPKGEDLWMIQTNDNTVFQGMVTRLSN